MVDAQARLLLGGIGLTRWKRDELGRLGTDTKTRLALMGPHADRRTLFIETERAYRFFGVARVASLRGPFFFAAVRLR